MAKRARLLTAEDVLDEVDLEDDYDDFDEPMMQGSNDVFDLEDEEDNEATPSLPTDRSSNLTPLIISDFNSSVAKCSP